MLLNVFWLKNPSFSFLDKSVSKLSHKERSMTSLGYQWPYRANSHHHKHSRAEDQRSSTPIKARAEKKREHPQNSQKKKDPWRKTETTLQGRLLSWDFSTCTKAERCLRTRNALTKHLPKVHTTLGSTAMCPEWQHRSCQQNWSTAFSTRASLPPGHLPRHEGSAQPR